MTQQPTGQSHADAILKYTDRIPALSPTVAKIMQVANSPTSTANDLNKVISLDPVLTARILKLVNSAYFSFSERITSTVRAIVILGLNTIKNLALSSAAMATFKSTSSVSKMDMTEFWKHSLGCGVAARLLADKMKIDRNSMENYFIAGLLHDIGKIVISQYSSVPYLTIINAAKEKSIPLLEAEKKALGITHTEVGNNLAEKWKLDNTLSEVISFHHEIQNSSLENTKLVTTISLVNILCKKQNIGFSGNSFIESSENELLSNLGLVQEDIDEVDKRLPEGIQKALIFLQV